MNEQNYEKAYDPIAARERRAAREKQRLRKQQRRRRMVRRLVALCLAVVLTVCVVPPLCNRAEQLLYPRKYAQATSSVDARGLMQMTEETFLWMRSKIAPDEPLTFADLYSPDTAIRFGCYYLHLCMVRYKGDVSTAAAAYHSGWGTVDQLLQIEEHSADGETLQGFPYNQMHHYVNKITACYQTYQRLYAGQ